MAMIQVRSKRKFTGGLYNDFRKRKKRDFGSDFFPTRIGSFKAKSVRTLGANKKHRLIQSDMANVIDKSTGKAQKSKIITVKENPANPNYVRMNIITRGAVIETELGLAKVMSRPGQDGVINAILLKKE